MSGVHRLVGIARLVATIGALVVGELVLHLAGQVLPSLSLDAERLSRTFEEAEPLAVAVSALRLVALVVGGALLVVTAAGVAARAVGAAALVAQVDRWTPRSLRRLLDTALGAGLAVSIGMTALPAGADPAPPPTATLRRLADARPPPGKPPSSTTALRRLADAPSDPTEPPYSATTLRRLPDGASPKPSQGDPVTTLRRLPDAPPPQAQPASDPSRDAAPAAADPAPTPPRAPAPTASPMAGGEREVTVRPGDSFWRLAEHYEAERLGRRPSEAEVGARWQELVAINRHRLVVPGDSDLLFPGQVLQLPRP